MSATRKSTAKTLKSATAHSEAAKSGAPKSSVSKSAGPKSAKSGAARKLSAVESRRSSITSESSNDSSRSSTSSIQPLPKLAGPILPLRRCSAGSNLQTHPCFQSSLFSDQERAAGTFKEWRERMIEKRLIHPNESVKAEARKDHRLKQVLWSESVKQPRRMTIGNTQDITDWDITILKRAKSYALAALGDNRGKVNQCFQ